MWINAWIDRVWEQVPVPNAFSIVLLAIFFWNRECFFQFCFGKSRPQVGLNQTNVFRQLRTHSMLSQNPTKVQPQSTDATTAAILDRYATEPKAIDATRDECWGHVDENLETRLKTQMSKND